MEIVCFFFSSRRRHTRSYGDWSSDVCSSDLARQKRVPRDARALARLGRPLDQQAAAPLPDQRRRSEERRVGKECRSRRQPAHQKTKNKKPRRSEIPTTNQAILDVTNQNCMMT